jgi:hypothetical protein
LLINDVHFYVPKCILTHRFLIFRRHYFSLSEICRIIFSNLVPCFAVCKLQRPLIQLLRLPFAYSLKLPLSDKKTKVDILMQISFFIKKFNVDSKVLNSMIQVSLMNILNNFHIRFCRQMALQKQAHQKPIG